MSMTLPLPALQRADQDLNSLALLTKIGASKDHAKLKATAEDFEAQFLGSMFSNMISDLKGDGPLGDEGIGADAFRGMLTDELGRSVARAGGIGIAPAIYGELLKLQTLKG